MLLNVKSCVHSSSTDPGEIPDPFPHTSLDKLPYYQFLCYHLTQEQPSDEHRGSGVAVPAGSCPSLPVRALLPYPACPRS